ncbi:PTS sugar transporter subunit IIA [Helcococcus ovis]|uniref:PTS sugar transporter subunit IIA n=1 Tax=Helcococcus ovis TaxID=72026 RepID=UPI001ADCA91D|nr:fructose PTS transporter subunit IIA [Helcococcus ovis]WNZ01224.1 fructose PTS transporter subunit IIA [Helcococcus ovis]
MNNEKKIENVIYKQLIFLNMNKKNKIDIFDYIANKAKEINLINNIGKFIKSLEKREKIMPTNIGNLIGIPHGQSDSVNKPFIAFMRLEKEIDWINYDSEKVKLIFMIGVPEINASKIHLKIISELSKKLIDEDFKNMLLHEIDQNIIYEKLNSIKIKEEK